MSNRIERAFEGRKAFIPFLTCNDPDMALTLDLVLSMADAGSAVIELGIPFSDPIAEGPVIQKADERALQAGFKLTQFFSLVEQIRKFSNIPLVCMTYLNPVYHYGKERFLQEAGAAGLDGIIVPDLPYESRIELEQTCIDNNIQRINMIAPTSRQRICEVASHSKGFLYCVSSLGVTGMRTTLGDTARMMVEQAKQATNTPCAVGFGIHTEEQARVIAEFADGIIVGSAIVNLIAHYGHNSVKPVETYVRSMKKAITG
ncbi:MAG: tryptophan synthase subunit alpha [Sphaerochaeta sp.]|jgi:tryptophan synthase alpha chain|uniref:tryptophan synthase subunit alpha n=1 Tax=Sphaerochaeta sp. TaxID=1972642 RepID=UPI002FC8D521